MLRHLLINLSQSSSARSFVTHFGLARRMARRFVAGETLAEAVAVVRELNTLDINDVQQSSYFFC